MLIGHGIERARTHARTQNSHNHLQNDKSRGNQTSYQMIMQCSLIHSITRSLFALFQIAWNFEIYSEPNFASGLGMFPEIDHSIQHVGAVTGGFDWLPRS